MIGRILRSTRSGASRQRSVARAGTAVVAGAMLLGLPAGATAQFGLEGVFSKATDLNFFVGSGKPHSSQMTGKSDTRVGFEIAFEAARIPRKCHRDRPRLGADTALNLHGRGYCDQVVPPDTAQGVEVDSLSPTMIRETWTPPATTSYTLTELDVGRIDSVRKFTPATKSDSLDFLVEAALGYAYAGGFQLVSSTVDVRGYVRELPSVSLYATEHFIDRHDARLPSLYVGFRSGLIGLQNVQAVSDTNSFTGSAQAFQGGGVLGLVFGVRPGVSAFVERAYMLRRFSSIEWKPAAGGALPPDIPRTLDLSGWTWNFGVQVGIPK